MQNKTPSGINQISRWGFIFLGLRLAVKIMNLILKKFLLIF